MPTSHSNNRDRDVQALPVATHSNLEERPLPELSGKLMWTKQERLLLGVPQVRRLLRQE